MFDMGMDKLIFVGVIVGLIIGPERLREWRHSLPRAVGRMHALYLQGKSQVVDDLNELAPDWREYDPRLLHPKRIIRDLTDAAAQQALEADRDRAKSGHTAGVSPGDVSASDPHPDRSHHSAESVRGDVDRTARPAGEEDALSDLDQQRNRPRDAQEQPGAAGKETREQDAERDEEDDVRDDVEVERGGSGHDGVQAVVEEVDAALEVHRPEHDHPEGRQVQGRRDGSTATSE
nr:hypothetical protein [Microbacterium sp. Leaf436]